MGNRFNLTLLDEDNIRYFKNIKNTRNWSWDEVLRRHRYADIRETRSELFDLEFVNMISWLGVAYPDRPDLIDLMETIRSLITNPALLKSPDLINVLCMRIGNLHGEMVKAYRMHQDQQTRSDLDISPAKVDPRLIKVSNP
jgi:hypothetical protein